MNLAGFPWGGMALAALGALAIWFTTYDAPLAGAILLVWICSLLLRRREPPPPPEPPARGTLGPEQTRELIEPLSQPYLMMEKGRISIANRAAREVLGPHIVGQDARVAIRHPEAIRLLDRKGGGTATIRGLSGPRSIWNVSVRPVDDARITIELVNRTAEADISRAHTDFVANASHELRTPLSSIIGYVETMLEADADDGRPMEPATRHRFLEVVAKEGRRLQALVEDLMSLSRVEAGKHELPPTVLDLRELAEQVVSGMTSLHGKDRIVLDADPHPMPVRGDTQQLDQLMRNLIDNAMKYGSKSEPVRVTAKDGEASYELTVADSGEGIAPEHLPHLTRRFYRTDPGRSRAAGGTGLGLAIVKHIVERHRGRLDIASELGVGTTITVRLPRHVEDESQRVKKTVA
ncbi:MAG: two-component sensor histidine kinase [Croceicoccus sp.]|nr:two-component sensor histidine kinase [Croceicoccus sp.]MAL25993.1 two-component sensor histidine kinase [Croceicoccus sp.]|tara:strand:- start:29125 stop:30345 length:1221 start_codon:yes stop_codon:yes gene_type:complete